MAFYHFFVSVLWATIVPLKQQFDVDPAVVKQYKFVQQQSIFQLNLHI